MGRSFRGQEREKFRQNSKNKSGKNSSKHSPAEQEVSELLHKSHDPDTIYKDHQVVRTTPPPAPAKSSSIGDTPVYKDLAGRGHLTRQVKEGMPVPSTPIVAATTNTVVNQQATTRYRQAPDPDLSILPPEMLVIDPANPLRGEVKFFNSRPEKLFGFIIVDPPGMSPTELATLTPKEQVDLRRKEVFFHFNDGGLVIWKGNKLEYPSILEQRNDHDFNIPHPTKGDRLVFFPIMVRSGPNKEQRSKAVPWAFERDWETAKEEIRNATYYRFVRTTKSFSQTWPTVKLVWGGREHNWSAEDRERINSCFDRTDSTIVVKHLWQKWNPEKGPLNYEKGEVWENCEKPY